MATVVEICTNDGSGIIFSASGNASFANITASIIDDYPNLIGYSTESNSTSIEYSKDDTSVIKNVVEANSQGDIWLYIVESSDLSGGGGY